jgi:hypothetical protein
VGGGWGGVGAENGASFLQRPPPVPLSPRLSLELRGRRARVRVREERGGSDKIKVATRAEGTWASPPITLLYSFLALPLTPTLTHPLVLSPCVSPPSPSSPWPCSRAPPRKVRAWVGGRTGESLENERRASFRLSFRRPVAPQGPRPSHFCRPRWADGRSRLRPSELHSRCRTGTGRVCRRGRPHSASI